MVVPLTSAKVLVPNLTFLIGRASSLKRLQMHEKWFKYSMTKLEKYLLHQALEWHLNRRYL